MKARLPRSPNERGFALLAVLWTMVLLSFLGTQLASGARTEAQLARNLLNQAATDAAMQGAVQLAIFHLLDVPERRWPADGLSHEIQSGGIPMTVTIGDEADKVDLNTASPALLQSLLLQFGCPVQAAAVMAARIADWRTSGNQPRLMGAKAPQYAAGGRDYAPPGEDFRSVRELRHVLGMTPDLLAALAPHVTVYSEQDPTAGTRDPVVAAALLADAQPGIGAASIPQVVTIDVRAGMLERRTIVRLLPQTDVAFGILAIEQNKFANSQETVSNKSVNCM